MSLEVVRGGVELQQCGFRQAEEYLTYIFFGSP